MTMNNCNDHLGLLLARGEELVTCACGEPVSKEHDSRESPVGDRFLRAVVNLQHLHRQNLIDEEMTRKAALLLGTLVSSSYVDAGDACWSVDETGIPCVKCSDGTIRSPVRQIYELLCS